MTQIILIIFLVTICLTIYVTHICYKIFDKYIRNLKNNVINLSQQNKNLNEKIFALNNYWQEHSQAREQDFVKKLRLFEINDDNKILVHNFDNNFLTLPCSVRQIGFNEYKNRSIDMHFEKQTLKYHLNITQIDNEYIEQILSQHLVDYLLKEKFVRGKYSVQNDVVEFYVSILNQIK